MNAKTRKRVRDRMEKLLQTASAELTREPDGTATLRYKRGHVKALSLPQGAPDDQLRLAVSVASGGCPLELAQSILNRRVRLILGKTSPPVTVKEGTVWAMCPDGAYVRVNDPAWGDMVWGFTPSEIESFETLGAVDA
jgi:hypothetical protein